MSNPRQRVHFDRLWCAPLSAVRAVVRPAAAVETIRDQLPMSTCVDCPRRFLVRRRDVRHLPTIVLGRVHHNRLARARAACGLLSAFERYGFVLRICTPQNTKVGWYGGRHTELLNPDKIISTSLRSVDIIFSRLIFIIFSVLTIQYVYLFTIWHLFCHSDDQP